MNESAQRPPPRGLSLAIVTALYLAAWTLFRLWFCGSFELSGDEAFYWLWSRNLDECYYSKGPGIAVAIRFGAWLFRDTVLGVRCLAPLLSLVSGLMLFSLARRLFSAEAAAATVVAASLMPLFLAGSLFMTADPLSFFFWIAAAVVFWESANGPFAAPWALTGLLVGLGAACAYTNLFELVCFGLFCAVHGPSRRWLARPRFWLMVALALLALAPMIHWNARNGWITVRHLLDHGGLNAGFRFRPTEFLSFLGQQALVAFPPFFAGMFLAAASPLLRRRNPAGFTYALCLWLPLFAAHALRSFNDAGQSHATAPAYAGGVIMLAAYGWERFRISRGFRAGAISSVALAALTAVALHAVLHARLPGRRDPLRRIRGSAELAAHVARLAKDHAAEFVIADRYDSASLLSFYLPGQPRTFLPRATRIRDEFSFWPDYGTNHEGRNAVYVADDLAVPESILREFHRVSFAGEFTPRYRARPVQTFRCFLCENYRGPETRATDRPVPWAGP
jgi:4-amino-4-deoxy-L-arabinose transferase-like glycosyltransferase